MAETSKSTTKEKAAKTKAHNEQEGLLNRELEGERPSFLDTADHNNGGPDRKRHKTK